MCVWQMLGRPQEMHKRRPVLLALAARAAVRRGLVGGEQLVVIAQVGNRHS
jgi:hypothetical protein